ncbi:maltokinase N-terminal cap-like domain-containing protein [Blastococcus haudaquaticus]|nr:1,4-alpha-glucan branching protein [Blastococcus haudaquaticus]
MATVHATTMAPTKLELLTGWLPRQPWYRGFGTPALSRAGGFRLDDPAGEVGIELMLVSDGTGAGATTYFVPLTYRGAALDGADAGLVGTSEHGVLGTRWLYDAEHDPVASAQLLAFVAGAVEAQHQSESDTLDPTVGRSWTGDGQPRAVELVRVPEPGVPTAGRGAVEVDWTRPDGSTARGVVAVAR